LVLVDALATLMALVALAALAANLFLFRFSAGVALGRSRTSPGITLSVPVANLLPVSFWFPATPQLCDVSLELVDSLASFSSKPVEAGPAGNSFPVISLYEIGCLVGVGSSSARGLEEVWSAPK
jgi:hypothetical protein